MMQETEPNWTRPHSAAITAQKILLQPLLVWLFSNHHHPFWLHLGDEFQAPSQHSDNCPRTASILGPNEPKLGSDLAGLGLQA